MHHRSLLGLLLVQGLFWFLVAPTDIFACSALFRPGPVPQLGKNYDWYVFHGHAAMFINPRGIARQALALTPNDDRHPQPAHWVSQLGSVTFTQFGVGLPLSGMNEAGLSIEILQLDGTQYPQPLFDDSYFTETQWIQFSLDQYRSVQELLEDLDRIRILPAMVGAHYMVADATGAHAVIEFLNGKAVSRVGARFLTNDPFASSERNEDPSWYRFIPRFLQGPSSVNRAWTLSGITRFPDHSPDSGLYSVQEALNKVRIDWGAVDALLYRTQWSLVHSMSTRHIEFRTRGGAALLVALKDIDFDGLKNTLVYDVDRHEPNGRLSDVTGLAIPLTPAFNLQLLSKNKFLLTMAGKTSLLPKAQALAQEPTQPNPKSP